MSTRGTILDNLATQLATILTANGFVTNVEEVLRDVEHSEQHSSSDPYLTIEDGGPDLVQQYGASSMVRTEMSIGVRAQVKGATADAPPTDELDNIIDDVRKLIHTPVSLGASVCYAALDGIRTIVTSKTSALLVFDLSICYGYSKANP
jgi:hypothetical protein